MKYIKATLEHTGQVYQIVQDTINAVYPRYYPKEVVDFFCQLHNMDNIQKDIEKQNVGILIDNQSIAGMGCRQEEHIICIKKEGMSQLNIANMRWNI